MPRIVTPATVVALAFVFVSLSNPRLPGQEPGVSVPSQLIPHAQDRPPGPALSPAEAIAAMTVPEGFTVELVAAEPDIVNPVAMTFDERGRIWITESLEYPRREPGPGRDRVKILEDTDGDGVADRVTIFAEGLNIPSGIAVGHGGVWVANAPDILFYPDADRDGVADGPPEVVVTGFGRDDTHELPNSLTWGPDGRLYGWNGVFNPSRVTNRQGETFSFTCAIFRIHPKTRDFKLFCEGTSNPWGIAINADGELFASACVIDHLWHLTETGYYIRQGGPYPPHTWPIDSIVDHTHQKAAYCGITYFDSDAYPPEYRGRLYMGNIHGNCINVDVLSKNGSTYRAEAAPDFLSANDAWFMPVAQKTGPDGSLYILDWYDRYHCYQDANRDPTGIDRLKGRLYRVRYGATPRRAGFDLGAETDEQLIHRLAGGNVYDRDIAQRLLTERLMHGRAEPGTAGALATLALDRDEPRKARLHALWALLGGGGATEGLAHQLLQDDDPTFRAWGIRSLPMCRHFTEASSQLVEGHATDPSPEVRLQVAVAARRLLLDDPVRVLVEVLSQSGDDPLMPRIVWRNLNPLLDDESVRDRFVQVVAGRAARSNPILVEEIIPRALDRFLTGNHLNHAARLVQWVVASRDPKDPDLAKDILSDLARDLRDGGIEHLRINGLKDSLGPVLRPILDGSPEDPLFPDAVLLAATWKDPKALEALRRDFATTRLTGTNDLSVLDALIFAGDTSVLEHVSRHLAEPLDRDVRDGLFSSLRQLDDPRVGRIVLEVYPRMAADLKPRAIELLTARPAWSKDLLKAVAAGSIPKEALNVNQLRRLQGSGDPEVVEFVRSTWGTIREGRDPRRDLILGQMRNFLRKTPGDPIAGREAFRKVCGQCHVLHGEGVAVGPDITLNGRNDFEQLLSNVFDPNLVIGPAYQATTVATTDGRILTGLLAEDSPERVTLKLQGGETQVIPRADVEEMKTAEISLMPEDLETQLSPQELADLFSYLSLDRPPEDPTARRLPGAPEPRPSDRDAED